MIAKGHYYERFCFKFQLTTRNVEILITNGKYYTRHEVVNKILIHVSHNTWSGKSSLDGAFQ